MSWGRKVSSRTAPRVRISWSSWARTVKRNKIPALAFWDPGQLADDSIVSCYPLHSPCSCTAFCAARRRPRGPRRIGSPTDPRRSTNSSSEPATSCHPKLGPITKILSGKNTPWLATVRPCSSQDFFFKPMKNSAPDWLLVLHQPIRSCV